MMKKALITVFSILAGTFMYAQNGPKEDDRIAYGTFPNGMSYYVASNGTEAGFADFALVCRHLDGQDIHPSDLLSGKGRIRQHSFQKFLSDNSVAPDKSGYARLSDGAMSLNFSSVMLNRSPKLVDSLFLALFDAAEQLAGRGVPLEELAIMVSGDLDRGKTIEKMKIFSMMIQDNSGSAKAFEPRTYENPAPEIIVDDMGDCLKITGIFPFKAVKDGRIHTARYAVMNQLANTLGAVAADLTKRSLDIDSIPYSDTGFSVSKKRLGGTDTWNSIEVHFCTLPQMKEVALNAFARALSSLPQMNYSELRIAARRYYFGQDRTDFATSNAELVRLCSESFIYGSPMIRDSDLRKFCRSKEVADSLGLNIMQDFASAVVKAPSDSAIRSAWTGNLPDFRPNFKALEKLPDLPEKKSHVRSSTEALTGGTLYKAANGFRVYYKRVPGADKVHWGLSIGRGYSLLENIEPGQAAFLSELLPLFSVCGISSGEFQDLLNFKGITCDTKVNLYSTYLGGVVSHRSLTLLMRVLAGYFSDIRPDAEAVQDYLRNLPAEAAVYGRERNSRIAAIDSLLCAGNPYTGVKMYENFDTGLIAMADTLFRKVFASADDAFIVISGDIEAEKIKKLAETTAGMFETTGESYRKRRVMFQPVSGCTTAYRHGDNPGIEILMSTALPMTAENMCAAVLTTALLKEKVREAIVGTGYAADVSYSFVQYPRERFSVMVSVNRIAAEGYDLSQTEFISELELVERLRNALKITDNEVFGDAIVETYRKLINTTNTLVQQSPVYWIETIVRRYTDGRDLRTKIIDKMNAVSKEKIISTMEALASGSRIELIVTE